MVVRMMARKWSRRHRRESNLRPLHRSPKCHQLNNLLSVQMDTEYRQDIKAIAIDFWKCEYFHVYEFLAIFCDFTFLRCYPYSMHYYKN